MKYLSEGKKLTYFIYLLIFKVVIEFIYIYGVSTLFGYAFFYYRPSLEKWCIAFILFLGVWFFIPKTMTKLSQYCSVLLGVYIIVPIISYYWLSGQNSIYITMIVSCYFFLNIILKGRIKIKIKYIRFDFSVLNILAIIMFLLWILFVAQHGMAGLEALNVFDVYELRASRTYSTLWGYLMSFMTTSITPAVLLISIREKKYWLTLCAFICQLYFYLYGGNKTVLLSIGVVLGAYYIINKRKDYLKFISGSLSLFIMLGYLIYRWFGNFLILSFIPMRTFLIPSQISFWYYDFFSQNQKLYLRESIFGRLLEADSPYGIETGKLIGNVFGQPGNNCNNGYLGYAYADGGFLFMILATIILAIIFLILDNILTSDNKAIGVGLLSYTMVILADGALLSTLLTGGFLLNIVILYLYSSQSIRNSPRKISKGEIYNE